MNTLNADRVNEIFTDCLFKKGEPTEDFIPAQGIVSKVGFHPGRLETHKEEVMTLLNELPDDFKMSGGGGWLFLNACNDKHGVQWGGHQNMEQLFQLGIATDQAEWQMMEMKDIMPGGVPYVVVLDK